jgi:hypothetical protein
MDRDLRTPRLVPVPFAARITHLSRSKLYRAVAGYG